MKNKGLEDRFLNWHDQFADVIFRHCFFRISDRDKAKDITQETFIRLWKYIIEGNEIANPRAFLYKIANNLIIDEYRKKETSSLDHMREEYGFDVGYDVRKDIEVRDEHERLLAMIKTLPNQYREALVMRHVDGLSVKEIARITGETGNVISVRIHRAIEKIRMYYAQHS